MKRDVGTPVHVLGSAVRSSREFEFVYRDGGVIEELSTDTTIPGWFAMNNFGFPTGRDETSCRVTHDTTGRPADDASYEYARRRFVAWRFAHAGVLDASASSRPTNDDPQAWERHLRDLNLASDRAADRHRFDQRNRRRDDETSERDPWPDVAVEEGERFARIIAHVSQGEPSDDPLRWLLVPRSAWRRALAVRLARLFGPRARGDIETLADLLSDDTAWHMWLVRPEFEPFRTLLREEPWRVPFMAGLHSIAARRHQIERDDKGDGAIARFVVRWRRASIPFLVRRRHPQESELTHQRAVMALRALNSLVPPGRGRRRTPPEQLAAVVWMARVEIVGPPPWSPGRTTVAEVARFFGVRPHAVSHLIRRLADHPLLGYMPIHDLVSMRKSTLTRLLSAPPRATLPEEEIRRHPAGRKALALIEQANSIEHGWSRSPDPKAVRPGPGAVGKARRLRAHGLKLLRELQIRVAQARQC